MLGSNLGDSQSALAKARFFLEVYVGHVLATSSLYETAPWGSAEKQNNYLNQALCIETHKSPGQLINTCLAIEQILGRERSVPNAPRHIDIDILLIDDLIIEQSNLQVPHPRMHQRNFCLVPLNEIAPQVVHPVFQKPVAELLAKVEDASLVKRLDT